VWIEGTSLRLIEHVIILWPVVELVDLIECGGGVRHSAA
jgi:hypothetical protein